MKKLYTILAAAAVLSLAGCTKEMIQDTDVLEPEFEGEEFVICATHEDYEESPSASATPETRTTIVNTKEVWWNATDKLMVYPTTGTSGSQFRANFAGSATAKTCYFTGTLDTKNYSEFYAFYPYSAAKSYSSSAKRLTGTLPAEQKALPNNIYKDLMVSYGSFTKNDRSLKMKPAYGGLKFTLSRDDIKSIEFTTNGSTALAGDFNIYFDKNAISAAGSDKTITLTAYSGTAFQTGVNYFIVIVPQTLSKGFTATLTTTDGKKLEVSTSKKISVKAGVFGTLAKPLNEYASAVKEYVDLGLPSGTMWATFNVGAEAPEEYGDYFAWGETEPKTDYSWSTYIWCNGAYSKLTKYCNQSQYWDSTDPMDYKIALDSNDDVARANWGSSWRMPTDAEWTELRNNCTWTWTTQKEVNGYLVTGSKGYSIFLPEAGDWDVIYFKRSGQYWSSSLGSHTQALCMLFTDSYYFDSSCPRYCGLSVRPVYGALVPVTSIEPLKDCDLEPGKTEKYTATVYPDNATDKRVSWGSSDESIAKVSQDGTVTAVSKGKATITAYSADGSKTASCTVTVAVKPQAVNLGLPSGTKWATFNVGASAPEDYGDYFAWGETEPKADYSWETYKWCNGSNTTLTRYCPASKTDFWGGSGSPDGKFLFKYYDYEDDAARVNWGGSWCMPTEAEWKELQDNCTWTWTTQNGVNGRLVTGSNSNSIFLPAAGYRRGTSLYDVGSDGYYWSSYLYTGNPSYSYRIGFYSNRVYGYYSERGDGFPVRPVLPPDK